MDVKYVICVSVVLICVFFFFNFEKIQVISGIPFLLEFEKEFNEPIPNL